MVGGGDGEGLHLCKTQQGGGQPALAYFEEKKTEKKRTQNRWYTDRLVAEKDREKGRERQERSQERGREGYRSEDNEDEETKEKLVRESDDGGAKIVTLPYEFIGQKHEFFYQAYENGRNKKQTWQSV